MNILLLLCLLQDGPILAEGFEAKVFAREPQIHNPCSMAFDERGRLFVGQGPQYRNPKPESPADSVLILIDSDRDGVCDRVKTFATGLNCIQGLAWKGRDLWIANAPDLTVVRDLDGDDEADEYLLVYTDLGNLEHGLHGLNWAPDGKLYMSKGNSRGLTRPGRVAPKAFRDLWGVEAPAGTPEIPPIVRYTRETYPKRYHNPADDWGREGGVLRCDDLGRNLEIVSRGMRNPWDIAFDDGFTWLGTDNDQNGGDRIFMPHYGAHFGWGHPWSYHWTGEGHLPTAPISAPVFLGSGTGVVYSTATTFPKRYRNVFLVNDWLNRRVTVYRPTWKGALLQLEGGTLETIAHAGSGRTMSGSSGRLFDPTDIEVGPDGALWVLSWGRSYGATWKNGKQTNEGRVYRIYPKQATLRSPTLRPAQTLDDLIADLDHDRLPVRRINAQEELVRRGRDAIPALVRRLESKTLDRGQETWTAWTLGRIAPGDATLDDRFARIAPDADASLNLRLQSLRILAHRIRNGGRVEALSRIVPELLRKQEARLRFETVQAVWQSGLSQIAGNIEDLAAREPDRLTYYASWMALRDLRGSAELRALLKDGRAGVRRAALLALLQSSALSSREIAPFVKDSDPKTAAVAALWLSKAGHGEGALTVDPPGGTHGGPVSVTLKSRIKGVILKYTLDGSVPTDTSPRYRKPIPIAKDAILRAVLLKNRMAIGPVTTHRYRIGRGGSVAVGEETPAPREKPSTIDDALKVLAKGDPARGRRLFLGEQGAGCFKCHRVGSDGNPFAPDLSDIGSRADARTLLESILDPNRTITEGYNSIHVRTRRGDDHVGFLLEETGLSLSIVTADGRTLRLPKKDIEARRRLKNSAMPDNYAKLLSPRQLADLVSWLASTRKTDAGFEFRKGGKEVRISFSGQPVASYVHGDSRIRRPYLAHCRAPGGPQITRTHPPVKGKDATDHATMHPGIWLAFGDLGGVDFWRNRGSVEHRSLEIHADGFTAVNRWDRICTETVRYTFLKRDVGVLVVVDARFQSGANAFHFGDQEEMGLGVRVATPITVKSGGRMLDAEGRKNEKGIWGKTSDWCLYEGTQEGRRTGLLILPDPGNFRPSWFHARDYGALVANAFGRRAFRKGKPSRVEVRKGEPFRLRYGVFLYAGDLDPAAEHAEFLKTLPGLPRP